MADSAPPARVLTQEEIQDIFEFYANFGRSSVMTYQDSLDSFMLCVRRVGRPAAPPPRTRSSPAYSRLLTASPIWLCFYFAV